MADEKILEKIQKVLNLAEGASTPEERDAALARADAMMKQHQLDEMAVRAFNIAKGLSEVKKTQPTDEVVQWVSDTDEFKPVHRQVAVVLARLAEVRVVFLGYGQIHVIGYPDAVAYWKMLWINSHLTFSSQLFPKWNKQAGDGANIMAYAEAGYKWDYIWRQAIKEGQPFTNKKGEAVKCPPEDNGWMKRVLNKEYAAQGREREPMRHAVRDYRNSFALAYAEEMQRRVSDMEATRRRMERESDSGTALVLKTDADALADYFRKLYPPGSLGPSRDRGISGNHRGAAERGRTAAGMADLSGGRGGVSGRPTRAIG